MKKKALILSTILFSSFGIANAACTSLNGLTFRELVFNFIIGCLIYRLYYFLISLAVVTFAWGVFKFVRSEGDDKQGGRELMFWGIVGLFVMVSFWGLVSILKYTFGF